MTLLVKDCLVEPPSDYLAIYSIFMISKTKFNMDILLLSEKDTKDFYYKYLLKKGLFDYIDYILTEEEKQEKGIRLDNNDKNPPVIKVKNLVFENQGRILDSIKNILDELIA